MARGRGRGREAAPAIYVLAGPNGGGKSSIGGATIRAGGAEYYNPDEATGQLLRANPRLSADEANALAWRIGHDRLAAAIETGFTFAFETTLGGTSITRLLRTAPAHGMELHLWFVALESADAHVARVRVRVAAGGHDIPEAKIRARFDSSRVNLIGLLPVANSVRVFDNSTPADTRGLPRPVLLLEMREGRIRNVVDLALVPEWAKPIVMAALRVDLDRER